MRHDDEKGPTLGPQVLFAFDSRGVCTLSTGLGLAQLGVKPGELVGKNLLDLYRDDASAQASLRRVLAGETFSTESEFGGRRLAVYYEPVRDASGNVTGAIGVSTDVTEQRRIEVQVRRARQRAALLAELSSALNRAVLDPEELLHVVVRSVAQPVADVGLVWLRATGRHELEPRGLWRGAETSEVPSTDRLANGGPQRLDLAGLEALSAPEVLSPEDAGESVAGLRVPLRSRGHLLGVIDIARDSGRGGFSQEEIDLVADIAERCALSLDNALLMEGQRNAREQLVKFQALADASDNLIGISDTGDRIVYSNPRVHGLGIDADGKDIWATAAVHAGQDAVAAIRAALSETGRWSGDLPLQTAVQEMVGRLEAFHLSHPDTGASLGVAWIVQDVTELRATETALQAANADLKQFKALVETSPDFIAIAGLDGSVKYVNPGGRQMIGMDPDIDVTTTTIPDYLTPEGLEASIRVERPAVIASGHWEGESTLRNHRGPAIPVAIASFLMHDSETGEPFALATVQRDITERLAAERALRELADQRQALLTRLVDAQDAERIRIAADVHDDPVQALAAVDLRLGLLRRRLRERAPELLDVLEPLQASVTGATDRLRALLFDLEPPDLERGLTTALSRAAEEIFESTVTRWSIAGEEDPEDSDATRAIAYRVAKEALNNVRKHAAAENVLITVRGSEGGLEVSIADDGVGLGGNSTQASPGHRGLLNMQDRAAVAGGRCSITNRPGGGTLVVVWLPGKVAAPA